MPVNYECLNFDGKICLEVGSGTYQVLCSGRGFSPISAAPERSPKLRDSRCVQAIWGVNEDVWDAADYTWLQDGCYFRDFMEQRSHMISDDDLCPEDPPTFTLIKCLNRFGLGYFEEDPSTGLFSVQQTEDCVGHKTHIINGTNPYHWEYTSETFRIGHAQPHLDLPEGTCVQGQQSLLYTIPADASNCNDVRPCMEVRRYSCVVSTETPTPEDPACTPTLDELLPSLLEDAFFCPVNTQSINLRRNGFCSTDPAAFRITPPETRFCEFDDGIPNFRVADNVTRVRYCDANVDFIRLFVQDVRFCSLDTINIRDPLLVQSVYFCSYDPNSLAPVPESVGFCSISTVIAKVRFCTQALDTLFPVDLVSFCEQYIATAATFCSTNRSQVAPGLNVGFCSMSRQAVEEDSGVIPSVYFCTHEFPENVGFCETSRKLIDGIPDLEYCEYRRAEIHGATNVTFCEFRSAEIHVATNVTFCSQDETMI